MKTILNILISIGYCIFVLLRYVWIIWLDPLVHRFIILIIFLLNLQRWSLNWINNNLLSLCLYFIKDFFLIRYWLYIIKLLLNTRTLNAQFDFDSQGRCSGCSTRQTCLRTSISISQNTFYLYNFFTASLWFETRSNIIISLNWTFL